MTVLLYGAYGYTGDLIARRAAAQGATLTLAGRRAEALKPLASATGMPTRAFGLDDPGALDAGLEGVKVVLHCAGPFEQTSRPMADACLRRGVHYLDITGEATVFSALGARDEEARRAGVMLLPGVGFDVVPTDCLAAHLKSRLPDATRLALAFYGTGSLSHGTATTMLQSAHRGGLIRRGGDLLPVPAGYDERAVDFGQGPKKVVSIPWGDVVTAWYSTGIPDITVYTLMPTVARLSLRHAGGLVTRLMSSDRVRALLQRRIDAAPAGPDEATRARGRSFLWGEASDADGRTVTARLEAPEGYSLTADAALRIALRVLAGEAEPGFRTPSRVFGADFVLELDGVTRIDG